MNQEETLRLHKIILESNKAQYVEILNRKLKDVMSVAMIIAEVEQSIEEVEVELFHLQNMLSTESVLEGMLGQLSGPAIPNTQEKAVMNTELESIVAQMKPTDADRLRRYNTAAELIQSNLPNDEVYVEVHQAEGLSELSYEMFIKIETDKGPMNILSPSETAELNSGDMTLESLMELVKSLKN